MEKIVLNGPGLYIAENINTNEQLLISVIGKAPMLRIRNAISINDFATFEDINNSKELRDNVENNPDQYSYSRFGIVPKGIPTEATKLYTAEEYQKWIQMKRENVLESVILTDICKLKNVEYTQAKMIWNQICSQQ